jgi:hypothetical protein
MKPSHRSVNIDRTICPYLWGVNAENVCWLGSSDGVVVIRTDKQSYGHTSLLITLLQLLYGKLAFRLNIVAVDAECLGDLG